MLVKIQEGDATYEHKKGKHELSRSLEYGQAKWGDLVLSKYLEGVYGPNGDAALEGRRLGEGELFNFSVHPGMPSCHNNLRMSMKCSGVDPG